MTSQKYIYSLHSINIIEWEVSHHVMTSCG